MSLKNLYLLAYNVAQFVAWSYCLFEVLGGAAAGAAPAATWARMGLVMTVAQNGALLEVLHAIVGLVRSPVFTTALQVASRVLLVNVVAFVPIAQAHWISQWMFGAWALVEVVRYLYYAVNLVSDSIPAALTWIRYSIFLFDYPAGVAGELGVLYISLDYFKQTGLWSFPPYFNMYYALMAIMASYAYGLPVMYTFMMKQRKKYLGGGSSTTNKGKSPNKSSRSKKTE